MLSFLKAISRSSAISACCRAWTHATSLLRDFASFSLRVDVIAFNSAARWLRVTIGALVISGEARKWVIPQDMVRPIPLFFHVGNYGSNSICCVRSFITPCSAYGQKPNTWFNTWFSDILGCIASCQNLISSQLRCVE